MFSDNFNRPNGAVDNNWALLSSGDWNITNNRLRVSTSGVAIYQPIIERAPTIYYLADYAEPVVANVAAFGQVTFQPFGHKRSKPLTSRANLYIDEMVLSMPNAQVSYNGAPILLSQLAIGGYFDNATINISLSSCGVLSCRRDGDA